MASNENLLQTVLATNLLYFCSVKAKCSLLWSRPRQSHCRCCGDGLRADRKEETRSLRFSSTYPLTALCTQHSQLLHQICRPTHSPCTAQLSHRTKYTDIYSRAALWPLARCIRAQRHATTTPYLPLPEVKRGESLPPNSRGS